MNKLEQLELTLNVVNKRLLPAYLSQFAMKKCLEWQFNCCKQACIVNVPIIKHFLEDEYKIECWEGFFNNDSINGDYNHCWNYLIHKEDIEKNIICDFTSTISYMNYGENDPTKHMLNHPNSVNKSNFTLIGMEQLDYEDHISNEEFYTGLKGYSINTDIEELLKIMRLW